MTQTTCPLHINSKNSERDGRLRRRLHFTTYHFSQSSLPPPPLSRPHGIPKWENGIDKNIYRFLFLSFAFCVRLTRRARKEKCEKDVVKKGKKTEMKCHLSILFQFLIKIFLGRDMKLEREVWSWRGASESVLSLSGFVGDRRRIKIGFWNQEENRFIIVKEISSGIILDVMKSQFALVASPSRSIPSKLFSIPSV